MGHVWDDDGERCVRCGDKDWFARSKCSHDVNTWVEKRVGMIDDNRIESLAEQFIDEQEEWKRDRYYHGLNVIAFSKAIERAVLLAVGWRLSDEVSRREAAEKDMSVLVDLIMRLVGDHNAPEDCYSTGPFHGDARDLVCPACAALRVASHLFKGKNSKASPVVHGHACREADRAMVATDAGQELIRCAISELEIGDQHPKQTAQETAQS